MWFLSGGAVLVPWWGSHPVVLFLSQGVVLIRWCSSHPEVWFRFIYYGDGDLFLSSVSLNEGVTEHWVNTHSGSNTDLLAESEQRAAEVIVVTRGWSML